MEAAEGLGAIAGRDVGAEEIVERPEIDESRRLAMAMDHRLQAHLRLRGDGRDAVATAADKEVDQRVGGGELVLDGRQLEIARRLFAHARR